MLAKPGLFFCIILVSKCQGTEPEVPEIPEALPNEINRGSQDDGHVVVPDIAETLSQQTWDIDFSEPHTGFSLKLNFDDTTDFSRGGRGYARIPLSRFSSHPDIETMVRVSGPLSNLLVEYELQDSTVDTSSEHTSLSQETVRKYTGTMRLNIQSPRQISLQFSETAHPQPSPLSTMSLDLNLNDPTINLSAMIWGKALTVSVAVNKQAETANIQGSFDTHSFQMVSSISRHDAEIEMGISGDLDGRLTVETRDGLPQKIAGKVTWEMFGENHLVEVYWLAHPFYVKFYAPTIFDGVFQTLSTREDETNRIEDWVHNSGVWWVPRIGGEDMATAIIGDYEKSEGNLAFTLHDRIGQEYAYEFQWRDADSLLSNSLDISIQSINTINMALVWDIMHLKKGQVFHKLSEITEGHKYDLTHELRWNLGKGSVNSKIFYVNANRDDDVPLPESREEAEQQGLPYGRVLTSVDMNNAGGIVGKIDGLYSPKDLAVLGNLVYRPMPQPYISSILSGTVGDHAWKLIDEQDIVSLQTAQKFADNVLTCLSRDNGLALLRGELF